MKTFLLITFALLLFPVNSFSKDFDFLFTEDQKLINEDIIETIKTVKDISIDSWFLSPPTRIELVTFALDQQFRSKFYDMYGRNRLNDIFNAYFKKEKYSSFSEDIYVSFSKEEDVFVFYVELNGVGKPKKPMKKICDDLLNNISLMYYPEVGWSFQETILKTIVGSFANPKTKEIDKLIKNNSLLIIRIITQYSDENLVPKKNYILACYKMMNNGKIHYMKKVVEN